MSARSTSVVTVVDSPDLARLRSCLDSVASQTTESWQHVIVVSGPIGPAVADELEDRAAHDHRVIVHDSSTSGDANGATDAAVASDGMGLGGAATKLNAALSNASGALVMVLGQHDVLAPEALERLGAACSGDVSLAYADHLIVGTEPWSDALFHKPDFSPELLRHRNYIGRSFVASRAAIVDLGGFRFDDERARLHDLVLRLMETGGVAHVPAVLCQVTATVADVADADVADADVADDADSGDVGDDADAGGVGASVDAVVEHCARVGIAAAVEAGGQPGCVRIRRELTASPLVSVVIPTCGTAGRVWGTHRTYVVDAVRSLVDGSGYQQLEFVVVYDESTPSSVLDALGRVARERLRLVSFDRVFNFSEKVNVGVAAADGEHLLILNDDTELIDADSIEVMVAHLQTPDVGMIGARLLYEDGTLQHGGHVYHHAPMHACLGWPGDSPGPSPLRPLAVEREVSGVTAAAALVRRAVFDEVGGFDVELPSNYNDVDFSLRVRAAGHRVIWSPDAVWYHFESKSRDGAVSPHETAFIERRWHDELRSDPYYNKNLEPGRHDWLERATPKRLA